MNKHNLEVLTNVIGAVESGGQIYGNKKYSAYADPYTNSDVEHTITLGWAQNYGSEAHELISRILKADAAAFRKIDTSGNIEAMLKKDWVSARWKPSAGQKKILIALIDSPVGHACQDELFAELMQKFIAECKKKYTKEIKAQMMYCEIRHLGGGKPVVRIFNRCGSDFSLQNILAALKKDQADTSSDNQVGDKKFWSRHQKCVEFIDKYAQEETTVQTDTGKETEDMGYSRQKVVDLVTSWIGRKESDGSHKAIIDIYNSTGPFPRNVKMQYNWPWCAATWSAIAKKLGYTAIMPVEISCYYIIEEAKKMGCWVENDAYIPSPADAVLYDWEDSGSGDNMGNPDHIGPVTYVNKAAGYMEVTEGNYGNAVKKRTISLNGRYIRGFITPKYTEGTTDTHKTPTGGKTLNEVAHEVIVGKWGDGSSRTKQLTSAGYDAAKVQAKVNEILNGSAAKPVVQEQAQTQPVAKKVTATCYASKGPDSSVAGTYKTTANLYLRNDAGTNKKALVVIPKGTAVKCYGYYSVSGGVKWLYIQVKIDGVLYTGFSSCTYLKKQ